MLTTAEEGEGDLEKVTFTLVTLFLVGLPPYIMSSLLMSAHVHYQINCTYCLHTTRQFSTLQLLFQ